MTFGALRHEGRGIVWRTERGNRVTRDAGTGLIRTEQGFRKSTVRLVAEAAIFGDRDVFVDPWAGKVLMAAAASLGGRTEPDRLAPVWVVAIYASQHALEDRVM